VISPLLAADRPGGSPVTANVIGGAGMVSDAVSWRLTGLPPVVLWLPGEMAVTMPLVYQVKLTGPVAPEVASLTVTVTGKEPGADGAVPVSWPVPVFRFSQDGMVVGA